MRDLLKDKILETDYAYLAGIAPDYRYIYFTPYRGMPKQPVYFRCLTCNQFKIVAPIEIDGHNFCSSICAGVYLRNRGEIK